MSTDGVDIHCGEVADARVQSGLPLNAHLKPLSRQKNRQTMEVFVGISRLKLTNERHMVKPARMSLWAGMRGVGGTGFHDLQITTYPGAEFVQYPHVRRAVKIVIEVVG